MYNDKRFRFSVYEFLKFRQYAILCTRYTYINTHTHPHTHANTHTHTNTHTDAHTWIHTRTHTSEIQVFS